MDQQVRVHNIMVTDDGYGSGVGQSLEHPFGDLDQRRLFGWIGDTAHWVGRSDPGGSQGLDDRFSRDFNRNIGAEIMGRNKFGPVRGPWENEDWKGWWGEEPPFHTPVFVLTHHLRPSFSLSDTTFHFRDLSPAEVLVEAKEAAHGQDIRIGGGIATIREFLEADLVDELHIAVSPMTAGHGERLWESPEELTDRFHLERVPSPSGVTHLLFWRR